MKPHRSGWLQYEMGAQARVARTCHDGPKEDGLEGVSFVCEVAMGLAEDRNNLRHLQPERTVWACEGCSVTVSIIFTPLCRMRPDLDAHAREWGAIARTAHGACHPEPPSANAGYDRGARNVIVGSAAHRRRRREALPMGWHNKAGTAGHQRGPADGSAGGEKIAPG